MIKTGELSISPLTLGDLEQAGKLFEASITDAFEREGLSHLQADISQEIEGKKQLANACLEPDNTEIHFWVASVDGRVVGTISYAPCGEVTRSLTGNELMHVGELGTLYILPEDQGQGIASALIAEVMSFLKKQGIAEFCLDSGYQRAQIKWQRKFGEPYKMVKDYWGSGSPHMIWLCAVSEHC